MSRNAITPQTVRALRVTGSMLLAVVILTLAFGRPGRLGAWPMDSGGAGSIASTASIHPSLEATVSAADWTPVIIALRSRVAATAPLADLAREAAALQAALLEDLSPSAFELGQRYSHLPVLAGRVSESGLAELSTHPLVESVSEDIWVYPLRPAAMPAGAPAALAESVPSVKADVVHQRYGIKGEGITIAVLDTGIDNEHPDFTDAIVDQQCFSSGSRSCAPSNLPKSDNAQDEQGHGTAVSGIALGRGNAAPIGMAPESKLLAVRVFRDRGGAPTADIVAGLNWTLQKQRTHNVRVVNMSLGGGAALGNQCDDQFASVKRVFQTLVARGVAIFVATGNGGSPDRVAFPGCISNGIGVGSTWDAELTLSRPNCHGETQVGPLDITCYTDRGRAMDLVAPGSVIATSKLGGGATGSGRTGGGHGTSFASPSAAGVAALVLQADPDLTPRDLERLLDQTGDLVIHPESGLEIKRVNALAAVESVLPPTPTPEPTPSPLPTDTPEPLPPTDTPEPPPTATQQSDSPDVPVEEPIRIYMPKADNGQAP